MLPITFFPRLPPVTSTHMFFPRLPLITSFPRLSPFTVFPALVTGYMGSRACHPRNIFPPLPPATRVPALASRYSFISLTRTPSHVFRCLHLVARFPVLATCDTSFYTGHPPASADISSFHVSLRLQLACYIFSRRQGPLHVSPRPPPLVVIWHWACHF